MQSFSLMGIILYFIYPIILTSISIYVSLSKEMTLDNYFFSSKNSHWFIIGASILTSSIFSPYLFTLAIDKPVWVLPLLYVLVSIVMLFILGRFIGPKFISEKINTIPQYFEKRFNKSSRYFVCSLYILLNLFLKLLIVLFLGNLLLNLITGIDAYFSVLFFLVITSFYLVIGGLRAELYISVLQVLFIGLVLGSFLFWIFSADMSSQFEINQSSFFSYLNPEFGSQFSLTELLFGLPIIGFWFWCGDQFIVQKILSTDKKKHIPKATFLTGALQFVPILIFLLPGIILAVFYNQINSDVILGNFFNNSFMPQILKVGLVVIIITALIASFSSIFKSTSVLITFDLYRNFKPSASDRELVLVGRLSIIFILFYSIIIIPVSQNMDFEFCVGLFKSFSYFIVMISALFIIGLVSKNIKGKSILFTLIIMTSITVIRTITELSLDDNFFSNPLLAWLVNSNFLQFTVVIFLLTVLLSYAFQKLENYNSLVNSHIQNNGSSFIKLGSSISMQKKYSITISIILSLSLLGILILIVI